MPQVFVGTVAETPGGIGLANAQGASDDLVLSNGLVTAVVSALGSPTDLAPTGGNLVDFGPTGGSDDLTLVYQIAGLLPDDAFAYHRLSIEDRSPDYVAVTVIGTLDGRPEVAVATRWELRACDPGLRVRTELWNGSIDTQAFFVADGAHWGKRRVVPFTPVPAQGFLQPELDLLELTAMWQPLDYQGAAAPAPEAPAYGEVACNQRELEGIADLEISALGTPLQLVRPGETVVFERLLVATAGAGPGPSIDPLVGARAQLFGEASLAVTGRIVLDGARPFGGDVRRASVVVGVARDSGFVPRTAVTPDADGTFAVTVSAPASDELAYELWSFGRKVGEGAVPAGGVLGDVLAPEPATVTLAVERSVGGEPADPAGPIDALVVFQPADAATRTAVTGTFHGRFAACAPWLGPPHGASPACNRVLVPPAGVDVEVPAGHYLVFATAGPEHTLAQQEVELVAGETTALAFTLVPVALTPPGWLSADLHVHGRASFDSGIPNIDRVRSFVAAGVDVIAATDHDFVTDYAETVAALAVSDRVAVLGGIETTPLLPFMEFPGEDLPRAIGHFNFWPLTPVPGSPRGGAPWDERLEPGELFDRMQPLVGEGGLMMMNHPWDEPQFGRDLGYLRAVGFDPRRPILDDGSPNAHLLRRPGGGHQNLDWNLIEVLNGAASDELQKARPLWFSLLAQGYLVTGTGNSDSHGLSDSQLGWARNWVRLGDTPVTVAGLDAEAFDTAVREGHAIAGNGIAVLVEVGAPAGPRQGPRLAPYVAQPGDVVTIEIRAAPWVPVTEVRVVTSRGVRVLASGAELTTPADPFGADGVVRYAVQLPLADLVDRDDFIIVEAGLALPPVGDLDDDGVPDTGDNDGNGVVDLDDVEEGEDTGPIQFVPDPTDPDDPRWLVTRVVPELWPEGFANPIVVDLDGDGWSPPGLP